jgi:hypothetical protein
MLISSAIFGILKKFLAIILEKITASEMVSMGFSGVGDVGVILCRY